MKALITKVSCSNYKVECEINSLDDLKKLQLEHDEKSIIVFKDENDDSIIQDMYFDNDSDYDIKIIILDDYFY